MAEQLALNNDERKLLFDSLVKAIDESGLSLNEFIFSSSDLVKTTFWVSLTANLGEQEVQEMRDRISNSINQIIDVLERNTNNVGEDMLVLSTVMLEAVNHVIAQEVSEEISVEE